MILLPTTQQRIAKLPLLFRAHAGLDESGVYALSYGQKVYAVHTRAGVADIRDQAGAAARAPSGMPRLAHLARGTTRLRALFLELGATQLATRTSELDHADWTNVGSPVVTANAALASDGSLTADTIADTSAAETRGRRQTFTVANDGTSYVMSIEVKKRSTAHSTGYVLINLRLTGGTGIDAYLVCDAFTGTVSRSVAGTSHGIEDCGTYWRIYLSVTNNTTGNTSLLASVYPGGVDTFTASTGVAGIGTETFARFQVETGTYPTSHIPRSSAAASRVADLLYFPFRAAPQALTLFVRGIERQVPPPTGTSGILHIGGAGGSSDPRIGLYKNSPAGYGLQHDNGATPTAISPLLGTGVAFGDLVELRGLLQADGAVQLGVSLNAGDEALSAVATAEPIAAAWNDARCYLNSWGTGFSGAFAFTHAAIASGAVPRDELRDLCEVG